MSIWMGAQRKRCTLCRQMTVKWERRGGVIHCFDGCHSTTGFDRRTADGKPLWERKEVKA